MTNFKEIVIGMISVSLFVLVLILFAIGAGNDYGLDVTDLEGGMTNLSAINQTIMEAHETSRGWKDIFGDFVDLNPFNDVLNLYTLFKTMWDVLTLPFDVLVQLFANLFPLPHFIGDVLGFMFITTIIFAIWKVLKTGE